MKSNSCSSCSSGRPKVGSGLPLEQLEREFDFIFIGVGLGAMERLGYIPGHSLPGVMDALRFIERYKTQPDFQAWENRDRDRCGQHRHRCRQCRGPPRRQRRPLPRPAHGKGNARVLLRVPDTPKSKVYGFTGWPNRSPSSRKAAPPAVKFTRTTLGEVDASGAAQPEGDPGQRIRSVV